jgi:hypothetical protein
MFLVYKNQVNVFCNKELTKFTLVYTSLFATVFSLGFAFELKTRCVNLNSFCLNRLTEEFIWS